jgi:calcineurin-like phosphoesterase
MKTDQQPLNSGFGAETTAEEIASGIDLRGKVCVITGGHSGIGLETTRVLAEAGAFVCVGARDMVLLPARSASLSLLHPYNY